ncbi:MULTISPECIES: CoA transferase [unclassified Micromonospora]|uniref:CaiB/BaiF CoA transferase family protein n=1 Tax=Micromonospora TaxID=1873 RepID=UPI00188F6732|nr:MULTISPECIES: CoA transferase [unclassified Micromonospora]MBF5029950.1 CoA transferase [Micromonospora sp. ANENR4]MCZ7474922.1 CoA transferase [Micromonospora sp. WMMC273]WBC05543.1 CoA transferase [Micromonospora sp. WMMA1976]
MDKAGFYREARHDVDGPLHGVRVLEISKVWAGPMTGAVLADLGCEVIRIEMPGNREGRMPPDIPGTGLSWFRETVHRNKRSVSLDLRREPAREAFLRLVVTADVVVENYRPGTLDGWGVGYAQCRRVNPDIVFVSISGWGQYGPRATDAGFDPIAQAAAGWMGLNGEPDGTPMKAPSFLADDLAGLHGAIGALAALRHRDRTGEGQHVDVSLLDALLANSGGYLTLGATGVPLRRWGDQADFVVPAGTYRCRDGWLYLAVALDKHWRSLAAAMDRPELARAPGFATNEERRARRDEVNALVGAWCEARTVAGAAAGLAAAGIPAEPVRDFADAAADPHVRERDMVQTVPLCNGTTGPLTGPAAKFSRTPTRVRHGAPAVGADTEALLTEAGVDRAELARLRACGATDRQEAPACTRPH